MYRMGNIKLILHYGGFFNFSCTRYEGGRVLIQENVDTDTLSIEELIGLCKELKYLDIVTMSYKLPHMSFIEGINKEFLDMVAFVEDNGSVVEVFADLLTENESVIKDDMKQNENEIHDDVEDTKEDESDYMSDLEETYHEKDDDLFAANIDKNINEEFKDWFNNEDLSLKSSRQRMWLNSFIF
jgi:hypothetical protein